jgi:glycosyltransferase involved in cell wall biosynthesis
MQKLATVIIPTYNRENLLIRALDSARRQTYRPLEVIVVDDGSTDHTKTLVKQWAEYNTSESFQLYYFYKPNGGPSSGRNVGLLHATGDYIYFLDADDSMHPDLIEEAIEVLERQESDCVIFGFDFEGSSGRKGQYLPPMQSAIESFLRGQLWGFTPSSLKRAELVRKSGPWCETMKNAEDYEYLGRALLNSRQTSVLRKRLLTVSREMNSLNVLKDTDNGLADRLNAEALIIEQLKSSNNAISPEILSAYASRLFSSAINMYAKGKSQFARELGNLALRVENRPASFKDRCKLTIWRQGRWLCQVWYRSARIYSGINKLILRANSTFEN